MDDIKNDPRFAHIVSDPRFRRMPKSKKKVKIDSRFQSLFTNKHFSHRTHIDKRGRPVLDTSKKNKHVMEHFYELSDSDASDSEKEELDNQKQSDTKYRSSSESNENSVSSRKPKKTSSKSSKVKKQLNDDGTDKLSLTAKRKHKSVSHSNEESHHLLDLPEAKRRKTSIPKSDNKNSSDDGSKSEDENEGSESEDEELPQFSKDYEIEETEVDHKWSELHSDAPNVSESTRRLAVCNMDWDFVKAQDLFVLFKSFVPEGGCVKSVAIYPSEFGKERMAEEMRLGPREMRNQNITNGVEEESKGHKKNKSKDQQQQKRSDKEIAAAQTEKLREYQLNRLRYYYAVVDCDSVKTSDTIYNECDGREYQLSSVRLDLRFIPDDMTFDDEPKEIFSTEQNILDYQPSKFSSTALCQAKVEVTWDETDFDRLSRRMASLQQKELESIVEENKYADIIAPPESDSEGEEDDRPQWLKAVLDQDEEEKEYTEEEKIQLYRKVLMDKIAEEEEEMKKEEEDIDKEIEVQPGLKSSVEKKMKKKEKMKDESKIVSEYLEKKKEKKKKKKELKKKKNMGGDKEEVVAFSDDDLPDDIDMEDFKEMMDGETEDTKPGKKKKKKTKEVGQTDNGEISEKDKAELELILLDDTGSRTLATPKIVNQVDDGSKKTKKKRKNKLAKLKKSEQDREEFVLDVNDPRFSALYSSHHFHIDPTAPQFKKSKNMLNLVEEQIKRKGNKTGTEKSKKSVKISGIEDKPSSKSVSQSLLDSLKRKMKK